ncbi:MAG: 6-carboxytetrahydropterin synthase [Ignisphaera sp.]|nr:6-carboxytetrahydropterin synthase [Ignisphaera sp.]
MHKIAKTFNFAYGHRVWSQQLNIELSLDGCLACRHLHGHEGVVSVFMSADKLTNSMVTDFKHLNWFKLFLDDYFDHKFIIDINDPLFTVITHREPKDVKRYDNGLGYFELLVEEPLINEFFESFVVVDFVPTSENISKYLYQVVDARMTPHGVVTDSITFKETLKSEATYYEV